MYIVTHYNVIYKHKSHEIGRSSISIPQLSLTILETFFLTSGSFSILLYNQPMFVACLLAGKPLLYYSFKRLYHEGLLLSSLHTFNCSYEQTNTQLLTINLRS